MTRFWMGLGAMALVFAFPGLAEADTGCAAPWSAWTAPAKGAAGDSPALVPRLPLGKAFRLSLVPGQQVAVAVSPSMEVMSGTYAGLATIFLEKPARIGVALSDGAGVDVVTAGTIDPVVEAGEGSTLCPGITRIAWYDLGIGTHMLQIVNAPEMATVMAVLK